MKEVKGELTIAELIDQQKVGNPQYVSVSVNDDFVKSEDLEHMS